jgi:hypothetical protein
MQVCHQGNITEQIDGKYCLSTHWLDLVNIESNMEQVCYWFGFDQII